MHGPFMGWDWMIEWQRCILLIIQRRVEISMVEGVGSERERGWEGMHWWMPGKEEDLFVNMMSLHSMR